MLERVGDIDEDVEVFKKHGILIDRDDEGYLLQLFTKPVLDGLYVFPKLFNAKETPVFSVKISKRYLKPLRESKRIEELYKSLSFRI